MRLHALPYGLENAMIEVRNDLLAAPQDQARIGGGLADALMAALEQARASDQEAGARQDNSGRLTAREDPGDGTGGA